MKGRTKEDRHMSKATFTGEETQIIFTNCTRKLEVENKRVISKIRRYKYMHNHIRNGLVQIHICKLTFGHLCIEFNLIWTCGPKFDFSSALSFLNRFQNPWSILKMGRRLHHAKCNRRCIPATKLTELVQPFIGRLSYILVNFQVQWWTFVLLEKRLSVIVLQNTRQVPS